MIYLENACGFEVDLSGAVWTKPPVEPEPVQGWIYIAVDSKFPEFIKIGRTSDMVKRLAQYNADKPYPTVSLYAISHRFPDVVAVERKLLNILQNQFTNPPRKTEWFSREQALATCENLIEEAEGIFIK